MCDGNRLALKMGLGHATGGDPIAASLIFMYCGPQQCCYLYAALLKTP